MIIPIRFNLKCFIGFHVPVTRVRKQNRVFATRTEADKARVERVKIWYLAHREARLAYMKGWRERKTRV